VRKDFLRLTPSKFSSVQNGTKPFYCSRRGVGEEEDSGDFGYVVSGLMVGRRKHFIHVRHHINTKQNVDNKKSINKSNITVNQEKYEKRC
jgi:hypothetical protein